MRDVFVATLRSCATLSYSQTAQHGPSSTQTSILKYCLHTSLLYATHSSHVGTRQAYLTVDQSGQSARSSSASLRPTNALVCPLARPGPSVLPWLSAFSSTQPIRLARPLLSAHSSTANIDSSSYTIWLSSTTTQQRTPIIRLCASSVCSVLSACCTRCWWRDSALSSWQLSDCNAGIISSFLQCCCLTSNVLSCLCIIKPNTSSVVDDENKMCASRIRLRQGISVITRVA